MTAIEAVREHLSAQSALPIRKDTMERWDSPEHVGSVFGEQHIQDNPVALALIAAAEKAGIECSHIKQRA